MTSNVMTLPYLGLGDGACMLSTTSNYTWAGPRFEPGCFAPERATASGATVTPYIMADDFLVHYQKLIAIEKDEKLWPEGADRPSRTAIDAATVVMEQLKKDGFAPTKIVASGEGGIAICFVAGEKYADIECLNSGAILGVITNRRDRPSAWEITETSCDIEEATRRISEFLYPPAPKKNVSRGTRHS